MGFWRRPARMIAIAAPLFLLGPNVQAQTDVPVFTTLYSFGGVSDGSDPEYQLLIGGGGVLYGTTAMGGASLGGTAFSLTPPSTPGEAWTLTTIQTFSG